MLYLQVEEAIRSAMYVNCPSYVLEGYDVFYVDDYEDRSGTEISPFCGTQARRSNNQIYSSKIPYPLIIYNYVSTKTIR